MTGWQRLLCSAAVGLAFGLMPWPLDNVARGLLGWCLGATVYLLPSWWLAERSNAQLTRTRARSLDQPNGVILGSMVAVVVVSVVVIFMLMQQVRGLSGGERALHIALGFLALTGSWLMIHTIYAFHYAHRFYQEEREEAPAGPGLDFPGKLEPDYFDFLYYAFVVGMTAQVSDVQVTSREMRRITLVHAVLSFAFNMLVLALSINVVAGAMQ